MFYQAADCLPNKLELQALMASGQAEHIVAVVLQSLQVGSYGIACFLNLWEMMLKLFFYQIFSGKKSLHKRETHMVLRLVIVALWRVV